MEIEQQDGVAVLNLQRLERMEEPWSLRLLRESVGASLPLVDLPEVILHVAQHTRLLSRFTLPESVAQVHHRFLRQPSSSSKTHVDLIS